MKSEHSRRIRRGDIYYADLEPSRGSEQGGVRPVIIIQNDSGNRYSPTVIVAAITSRIGRPLLPTHVPIGEAVSGLHRESLVLLEQVRTIDRSRLHDYLGSLGATEMESVEKALEISFGLTQTYK